MGPGVAGPSSRGRRAADHHPCSDIETSHDGIADRAGRVVGVDIDALQGRQHRVLTQSRQPCNGPRRSRSGTPRTHADLVRPASNADGTAPLDLGDLTGA